MPSENNCIIEDVDNEVNFLNPYDFNDSDSFDSSDDDDENCIDPCENNSFVSLNENDVLESFTFGDESLSNELANDLHEMLCGDDDMNIDASLYDIIDIELVNFHDNCLNDALYIHDLIGKDRSEESVTIEKENEEESFENEKVLFEEFYGKIIEEEEEKTRNESVREKVDEKVRNDEKESNTLINRCKALRGRNWDISFHHEQNVVVDTLAEKRTEAPQQRLSLNRLRFVSEALERKHLDQKLSRLEEWNGSFRKRWRSRLPGGKGGMGWAAGSVGNGGGANFHLLRFLLWRSRLGIWIRNGSYFRGANGWRAGEASSLDRKTYVGLGSLVEGAGEKGYTNGEL
nr:hypothetical protein Iba_chr05bCG6710 [Ipomoea batatas]